MPVIAQDRCRRLRRRSGLVSLTILLICAACSTTDQGLDRSTVSRSQQAQPTQTVGEPAASTEQAIAAINAFEREHNEAVRGGIDALLHFQAGAAWPAGTWTAAQIECATIPHDGYRDLYEIGSDRLELSLSNPRRDPEWAVPERGQPGAGDMPGDASWLVDFVRDGDEGQMHLAIQNGRALMFPAGPPCPIASIAPSDDDNDVALVWREVDTCRLGTTSWCRTWVVRSDGSVASEQLGTDATPALSYTGTVDRSLVSSWLLALETPAEQAVLALKLFEGCESESGFDLDRHVEVPSRSVSVSTCASVLELEDPLLTPLQTLVGAVLTELPTDGSELLPCDLANLDDDAEC